MSAVAPTLEAFFTERLMAQRPASTATVAAYRDTFRLLLRYMFDTMGKAPCMLHFEDLDAARIGAFLDHLEQVRGNKVTHPQLPAGGYPLTVPLRRASNTPSTPHSSSGSSPSPSNGPIARSSLF